MDALIYKIHIYKYYKDVEIDMDYITILPKIPTHMCRRLQYVDSDLHETRRVDEDIENLCGGEGWIF